MVPVFIAIATDGKLWICSDYDKLNALGASITHIYEVATPGQTPLQVATLSGAGSPYTITNTAVTATNSASGVHKIRK